MTIRLASAADIPNILRLLAATPNPPNEDEASIGAILDDPMQFTFVDPAVPVLVRMSPEPDALDDLGNPAPDVPIPWWVWEGPLTAAHLPILGVVARAVLVALPAAGPWPTYGDFPGAGATKAERLTDSKRQADEHGTWLGGVESTVSPRNPSMMEDRSTIAAVIAAIPEVQLGP